MPRFSAWSIRISLIYLASGFTIGALMLSNKGIPYAPWIWSLLLLHIEFLLFGWLWHLAMGVAYWILPRFSQGSPRGNLYPMWITLGLLNVGIWLVGLAPFFPNPVNILVIIGRFLEAGSALLFAVAQWKRVRPTLDRQ